MKLIASAFVVFTAPAALDSAFAAPDPTGIWMNDTGRGAVEIKQCGNALCGTVVWVKDPADAKGCGKKILGDVAPVGGGRWDNGWIYSPERGRKYDVELTPLADGTLRVTGYAGVKFLSKTMIWKRPTQDLQLCSATEAKAEPSPPANSNAATTSAAPPAQAGASPSTSTAAAPATEPAPAQTATAEPPKAAAQETASPEVKAPAGEAAAKDEAAPQDATATKKDEAAASEDSADAGTGEEADLGRTLGNLKLGDLGLDKFITRTKSGRCKLNTPWLSVQFRCEQ
jgi:uncharacterized protein (DUF2147 family)